MEEGSNPTLYHSQKSLPRPLHPFLSTESRDADQRPQ